MIAAFDRRVQDFWRRSENVRSLAMTPKVLALVEELYGRKPLTFQTLNFPVGTQQSAHSDTFHFNSLPRGYMCGVWVALEDIDMNNGPLMYYPGSHKWPEITVKSVKTGMPPVFYRIARRIPFFDRSAISVLAWAECQLTRSAASKPSPPIVS